MRAEWEELTGGRTEGRWPSRAQCRPGGGRENGECELLRGGQHILFGAEKVKKGGV